MVPSLNFEPAELGAGPLKHGRHDGHGRLDDDANRALSYPAVLSY